MRSLVKDLIEEARRASDLAVAAAHSPARGHRINGLVERAVRGVKDQVRILHSALSAKCGALQLDWPIIDWMAPRAAEALTGAQVSDDGMTAYRR